MSFRRTKIVATIGPATHSPEKIRALIEGGMNVARLNFSHGDYTHHAQVIQWIREISLELRTPVTILQDLQGPKIRVGKFEGGKIYLTVGELVTVTADPVLGREGLIPSDFPELFQSVQEGDFILLDDGLLKIQVESLGQSELKARVIDGGVLKDRKGMNIPGRTLQVEAMTAKDLEDLSFGLEQGVDVVALSFVRFGRDLIQLRDRIEKCSNHRPRLCAKIEMREAIENLEEIIYQSDVVMVARGDLAVEVGQSKLPFYQKRIIQLSNQYNKPVITATQMLDSMVNSPRPTRAEITDVANAVLDGADALMLSAETASGQYPIECVRTMDEIIQEIESSSGTLFNRLSLSADHSAEPQAIAASAAFTALKLDAKVIVCLSTTGKTAQIISSFRPKARLIAATDRFDVLNDLEIIWGVQSLLVDPYQNMKQVKSQIESLLVQYGLAKAGDKAVMTLGLPIDEGAKTNTLHTWTIKDQSPVLPASSLPIRFRP